MNNEINNHKWCKYKYYPHLNASEDLEKGGWILHSIAEPGVEDRHADYRRYQSVDARFARTIKLTIETYPPYQPQYCNWYNLQFPMLRIDMPDGSVQYDDLSPEIRQLCNTAEKHLLMDQLFEQFVYDKTGGYKNEWQTITSIDQDNLLILFNGDAIAKAI